MISSIFAEVAFTGVIDDVDTLGASELAAPSGVEIYLISDPVSVAGVFSVLIPVKLVAILVYIPICTCREVTIVYFSGNSLDVDLAGLRIGLGGTERLTELIPLRGLRIVIRSICSIRVRNKGIETEDVIELRISVPGDQLIVITHSGNCHTVGDLFAVINTEGCCLAGITIFQ